MSPSRPEIASERVLSVSAKSLARSAKLRRRLFLILYHKSAEFAQRDLQYGHVDPEDLGVAVLSDGLIYNLTPVPFRF